MIENFAPPDDGAYTVRGADLLLAKQMRSLQKEQRKFLRGILSVSDPIR